MKMRACPFCHCDSRLGVQTKWIGREGRVGAYARCKQCNARGPLVTLAGVVLDMRNERLSKDGKEELRRLAVEAWNGNRASDPLPLFEKEKEDDK